MLGISATTKADPDLRAMMAVHYSAPRGFVGRQLFYHIMYGGILYGCIAFGSATRFLPGRNVPFSLGAGMNNIFYHIEKRGGKYPLRNFTTKALLAAEVKAAKDYESRYGERVKWIESLVELPRTGELYLKAGYSLVGQTKGFTCKRIGGKGTVTWTWRRVWDTTNLRPKLVFIKALDKRV